jgi:hypothetical protein
VARMFPHINSAAIIPCTNIYNEVLNANEEKKKKKKTTQACQGWYSELPFEDASCLA